MLVAKARSAPNRGGSAEAGTRSALRYVSLNQPPSGCRASDRLRIRRSGSGSTIRRIPGSAPVPLRQLRRGPLAVVLVRFALVVVFVLVLVVVLVFVLFLGVVV